MNRIEIVTTTSYGAKSATIAFIEGIGGPECVKVARLNTKGGVPYDNVPSKEWPLVLECISAKEGLEEVEVCIFMLTSGYGGAGSHDLADILKYAGFKFFESDVYNKEFDHELWTK